jgi:hypothetical protein
MKKFLILSSLIFITNSFYAQEIWKYGTAKTLNQNNLQLNLIAPSQYGLNEKSEIQSNISLFVKIPNISVKHIWWIKKARPEKNIFKRAGFFFTTRHTLSYPTPLLKFAKKRNLTDVDIPFILNFRNEIIFTVSLPSYKICNNSYKYFTLKLGNILAIKNKNYFSISKQAFYFRQSAMFETNRQWYIGIQYDNFTNYSLFYKINFTFYKNKLFAKNFTFEQKSLIYYYFGKKNRLFLGLGYVFDISNTENVKPVLFPQVELSYIIRIESQRKSKRLFRKGTLYAPEETRDLF